MPLGLRMNSTREEQPPEERCSWCVAKDQLEVSLDQFDVSCLLLWWLVLFIEALVLFPNIEREGMPQWPNSKGDN